MIGIALEWRGEGGDVRVAGEFNNWQPRETEREGDKWVFKTSLQPGRYFYKWVIDGNWMVDESQLTEVDQSGNRNNVVLVEEKPEECLITDMVKDEQSEVPTTEKAEVVDSTEEISGDSDSWERVSVEDCAPSLTEELVQKEPTLSQETIQLSPHDQLPQKHSQTNVSMLKRKIERFFSPSTNFLDLARGLGREIEREDYPIYYWDTPDYTLMKQGFWCKQFRGKWLLRKLEDRGVKTLLERDEIEQVLQPLLGYKGSLEEYVEKSLTKQIHFEGAITRWELEGCEVEYAREGDFYTVNIRLEDSMLDGLKRVYALAKKLNLDKLKLQTSQ